MRRTVRSRKFGRIVAFVIVILLVSGVFSWGVNALFTIRSVEVAGVGIGIAVDQTKLPKNLLFFPVDEVRKQILKDYPLVGSVTVKKKYPGTLVITAIPRKPFAIAGVGRETYALDVDGVVLSQYPSQNDLPIISIAMLPMQPGSTVSDPAVMAAVRFLRETASVVAVSEITGFDASSLQARAESMSIVFPQNADILVLARTLQTITAGFRIKGKLPTTIDLRFDKPVVTF
ncbi:FtsQ-type POTRA domain-containing protein [Candidatus Gottesmanbacteria bacterium]|nr:FtsQ-type POTRA domain-containing protein [Candidatus Gottesmanbacteria bacterium]